MAAVDACRGGAGNPVPVSTGTAVAGSAAGRPGAAELCG